jgi:hypothetical protein
MLFQTTGADGRLRYGMSVADVAPTDQRFSSGVVEPESQPSSRPSSRPGSAHGAEGSFVAAPPAGRPSRGPMRRKTPDPGRNSAEPSPRAGERRGGTPTRRGRNGEKVFGNFPSYDDDGNDTGEAEGEAPAHPLANFRPPDTNGGADEDQNSRDDVPLPMVHVTDSLGPKIVQGSHEMTDMLSKSLDHWQQLHTLLQVRSSGRLEQGLLWRPQVASTQSPTSHTQP